MENILKNFTNIKIQIPQSVTLTVVTKKHPMQNILPLIQHGHQTFAENYINEAKEKWQDILRQYPHINLKLIGKLQSNKIKDALAIFTEIQSIHSLDLAEKISKKITNDCRTKTFYAQINIGNEDQKSGILPCDVKKFFAKTPIKISGLMCIPPENHNPVPYFQEMQKIKNEINPLLKLSMGMSGDFLDAIKNGSDEIRVGSAILGSRI